MHIVRILTQAFLLKALFILYLAAFRRLKTAMLADR